MLQYYFFLRQIWLIQCRFFIHNTTPYIHPRLVSRIESKFSDCQNACIIITHVSVIAFTLSVSSLHPSLKGIYFCPIEVTVISGLTDKGQFQYLTRLKGPQGGIYLYKKILH